MTLAAVVVGNVSSSASMTSHALLLLHHVVSLRNLYWSVLFIIEALVFTSNLLLICLILFEKRLYTNNTTRIVLSLSVTDLLLSIFVMPFTLYSQLDFSNWRLGYTVCLFWLSSDVQLTTTSIFHLCSISFERYLSIAEPVKFRNNMKRRISVLIALSWLLSFVVVTLPFVLLSFSHIDIYEKSEHSSQRFTCNFSSSSFIAYTTVVTFWLPLVVMVNYGIRSIYLIRKLDRRHNHNALQCSRNRNRKCALTRHSFAESSSKRRHGSVAAAAAAAEMTPTHANANVFQQQLQCEINVAEVSIFRESNRETKELRHHDLSSIVIANLNNNNNNNSSSNEQRRSTTTPNELRLLQATIKSVSRFKNLVSNKRELQANKTLSIVLFFFVLSYLPLFTYITYMSIEHTTAANRSNLSYSDWRSTPITHQITPMLTLLPTLPADKQHQNYVMINQTMASSSSYNEYDPVHNDNEHETFNDLAFHLATWLAYSSAIVNPVLHLTLNANFKNAFLSRLKRITSRS